MIKRDRVPSNSMETFHMIRVYIRAEGNASETSWGEVAPGTSRLAIPTKHTPRAGVPPDQDLPEFQLTSVK